MYEIRIHGRGGQGGVTSSIMGTLAASKDGKFAQALQIYGAERRGAPVVASLRIGDGSSRFPIRFITRIAWSCWTRVCSDGSPSGLPRTC